MTTTLLGKLLGRKGNEGITVWSRAKADLLQCGPSRLLRLLLLFLLTALPLHVPCSKLRLYCSSLCFL